MSIILKFDSKKKRSATIKNLYRYIVSGETKQNPTGNPDSVLATGNEKLIHIYSSHHIEPFLYSKKDDEAYIKNYIEEATNSFNAVFKPNNSAEAKVSDKGTPINHTIGKKIKPI